MTNNSNSHNNNSSLDIQEVVKKMMSDNSELGNDIKNLINSLSEDDIKRITGIMKNKDIQNLASSIVDSKKR